MSLMKMITIGLVSSLLLVSAQPHLSRDKRSPDPQPILDNLVGGFARPFLNLFGGGSTSNTVRTPKKKPVQSYHRVPKYHNYQSQQNYHAPKPEYRPAPAPTYHKPDPPTYHSPDPPTYHSPDPPTYHEPAPVYTETKPQIHILPSPDLSQQSPPPPVPVYQPLPTYVEEPAVAPVYQPTYKEEPALAPVYEPIPAQYDSPVYSPSVEVYQPVPVYTPSDFSRQNDPVPADPVPTDPSSVASVVVEKKTAPDTKPDIASLVDLKSNENLPAPSLAAQIEDLPDQRQPKLLNDDVINPIQIITNEIDDDTDQDIIIDLTNDLVPVDIEEEEVEEVLITGDDEDKKTQIFTLNVVQPQPVISGPPQKTNEIISFTPQQDLTSLNFQSFEVQPVKSGQLLVSSFTKSEPATTTTSTTTPTTLTTTETVTPIVANLELKSVFRSPFVNTDSFNGNLEPEVIDLRSQADNAGGFVLVEEDISVSDVTETATQDDREEITFADILSTTTTTPLPTTTISTAVTTATTTTSTQPVTELRQITFKILDDDEDDDKVDSVISFDITDDQGLEDTFSTESNLDDVPPTISSDPIFKEIVSGGSANTDDSEKFKRGFNAYDPRHQAVYAHKYSDNYSNWYYFRRGY